MGIAQPDQTAVEKMPREPFSFREVQWRAQREIDTMDKAAFDQYLKERYFDQIDWYDRKSLWNQKWYTRLQWCMIILAALTPALVAIDASALDLAFVKWIAVVTSFSVAVLAAALKTFKFQENWMNYRTTCETLRKEIHLYRGGVGEYSNTKDREALFVERVESLISRENTLWLTTFEGRKEKETTS